MRTILLTASALILATAAHAECLGGHRLTYPSRGHFSASPGNFSGNEQKEADSTSFGCGPAVAEASSSSSGASVSQSSSFAAASSGPGGATATAAAQGENPAATTFAGPAF